MATNDNSQCASLTTEIIDWIQAERKDAEEEEIEVGANTNLLEDGVFDSMKILQFVTWLESRYKISIGVEQLTPKFFSTPDRVARQVLDLQS